MAWTTPRTWVTGEVVTASLLNTHLRSQFQELLPVDQLAWDTWSPTLSNLTLGNGSTGAVYTQIAKLVIYSFQFVLGSTSAVGTNPSITAPVTASTAAAASTVLPVGRVVCNDSGTAVFEGKAYLASTTSITFFRDNVSGSNIARGSISSTAPMTWTTNDGLFVAGMYEAA